MRRTPSRVPLPGPIRRDRRRQSKVRHRLDRFRDHPDSILAFMRDFAIPSDNNQSDRDLRMMKLRQKISGSFRGFEALVNFCRIRGASPPPGKTASTRWKLYNAYSSAVPSARWSTPRDPRPRTRRQHTPPSTLR
jgi:transposase